MRPLLVLVASALIACTPPAAPDAVDAVDDVGAAPAGQWLTADGAGETALVFVPEGGREIALICAMGVEPTFRVETADERFSAVPDAASAAILLGDVAIEGALVRMATETGGLVQMRTPITETLIARLRAAETVRLNAGDAHVVTGAAPAAERDAFAARCASLAGLTGP